MAWFEVEELLDSFIRKGAASAVAASVRTLDRGEVFSFFHGRTRGDEEGYPIGPDARFDLASLTKVFATTTLIARYVDRGELDLEEDLRSYFPELSFTDSVDLRIDPILRHQAGFVWWMDFSEVQNPEDIFRSIASAPAAYTPGSTSVYSDLGFILLGEYLSRKFERSFDELVLSELTSVLGNHSFLYRPLDRGVSSAKIVATESVPWRGGVLHGTVHDCNTDRLGGVAGHAGLFGTIDDCTRLSMQWLEAGIQDTSFLSHATARTFLKRYPAKDGKPRALGWDVPTKPGSMAGELVSDDAFGHSGYTGTSSWIDIPRGAVGVLLTNRVHPKDDKKAIAALRPAFYDGVWKELTF